MKFKPESPCAECTQAQGDPSLTVARPKSPSSAFRPSDCHITAQEGVMTDAHQTLERTQGTTCGVRVRSRLVGPFVAEVTHTPLHRCLGRGERD
jgi:hypothetical protein